MAESTEVTAVGTVVGYKGKYMLVDVGGGREPLEFVKGEEGCEGWGAPVGSKVKVLITNGGVYLKGVSPDKTNPEGWEPPNPEGKKQPPKVAATTTFPR